jgi:hypothetical protein
MKSERVKAVKVRPGERFQKAVPRVAPTPAVEPTPPTPPTPPALDLKISEMPSRGVPLTTDAFPVVADGVNYKATIGSLVGMTEGSAGSGNTVDTGQPYKVIMLSDGTVRAVPFTTVAPVPPTGLTPTIRLTSVTLHWTAAAGSGVDHYYVTRDGVLKSTSSNLTYRTQIRL